MDGGQTTYWLYLLPPLLLGAFLCMQDFSKISLTKAPTLALWFVVFGALAYGWVQHVYGQSKGVFFGGKGGLKIEHTHISQISPVVSAIQSNARFVPKKSRLFLWGMPWQLFYFSKTVPSSTVLTNETFMYGIPIEPIKESLFKSVKISDFVAVENGSFDFLAPALANFDIFFQDSNFTVFVKRN
jgi:hypothetical protein